MGTVSLSALYGFSFPSPGGGLRYSYPPAPPSPRSGPGPSGQCPAPREGDSVLRRARAITEVSRSRTPVKPSSRPRRGRSARTAGRGGAPPTPSTTSTTGGSPTTPPGVSVSASYTPCLQEPRLLPVRPLELDLPAGQPVPQLRQEEVHLMPGLPPGAVYRHEGETTLKVTSLNVSLFIPPVFDSALHLLPQ
jgi:hypothetical protein